MRTAFASLLIAALALSAATLELCLAELIGSTASAPILLSTIFAIYALAGGWIGFRSLPCPAATTVTLAVVGVLVITSGARLIEAQGTFTDVQIGRDPTLNPIGNGLTTVATLLGGGTTGYLFGRVTGRFVPGLARPRTGSSRPELGAPSWLHQAISHGALLAGLSLAAAFTGFGLFTDSGVVATVLLFVIVACYGAMSARRRESHRVWTLLIALALVGAIWDAAFITLDASSYRIAPFAGAADESLGAAGLTVAAITIALASYAATMLCALVLRKLRPLVAATPLGVAAPIWDGRQWTSSDGSWRWRDDRWEGADRQQSPDS